MVKLIQSLEGTELNHAAERVRAGLQTEIGGIQLEADELLIESQDRPGFVSVSDGPVMVATDVTITAELAREGQARELVRHVQELRRTAGLEISDRIVMHVATFGWSGREMVEPVLAEHRDYISQETLADDISEAEPPEGTTTSRISLEGVEIELGVLKTS